MYMKYEYYDVLRLPSVVWMTLTKNPYIPLAEWEEKINYSLIIAHLTSGFFHTIETNLLIRIVDDKNNYAWINNSYNSSTLYY